MKKADFVTSFLYLKKILYIYIYFFLLLYIYFFYFINILLFLLIMKLNNILMVLFNDKTLNWNDCIINKMIHLGYILISFNF